MLKISGVGIREGVMIEYHWAVLRVGICAPAIESFISEGHFVLGHDWDSAGIGVINSASMDEQNQLIFEAELYEGVPEADQLAAIISQRTAAGKKVSVSMGFWSTGYAFGSGAELLGWLAREGDDLTQYDTAAISAWTDWVFLMTEINFVEASYVLDGACNEAEITNAFDSRYNRDRTTRLLEQIQQQLDQPKEALKR